jgi:hypothetical protein
MRAAAPELEIKTASIHGVVPGEPGAARSWSEQIAMADAVFCQLTDEQLTLYGLPSSAEIKGVGKAFVGLPVITFKGFQPDCTYIFTGGQAIAGAMGPYHSAIAAAAFLEGLDVERSLGLFNTFSYSALGYFAEFEAASIVLREKGAEMGLDLSASLQRGGPVFMHTINHPAISILGEVAVQGLARAGARFAKAVQPARDQLGTSFRWPVYPEIAARIGISGDLSFQRSGLTGEDIVDLRTVVEATHESLKVILAMGGPIVLDQNRPMATPVIERAQAFIRHHVVF